MKHGSFLTRPTHIRHAVLGIIILAYMITYMDRVSIASAMPVIQKDLGLSLVTVGWIFAAFRWGYAIFQIPGGWLGDRIGPRHALALIVVWWSVFTSLTALAWNAASMGVFRFLFGMGEAGAFPIATRALSRWLLPVERGSAQGLTHAGSRFGAALTPGLVVLLIIHFGWRMPFFVFGALGVAWAALWYWYYRDSPAEHTRVNAAERRLLQESLGNRDRANRSGRAVPWRQILRDPTVWALSLAYFCYGYSIDVYLDWFPKYLNAYRGFNLAQMGLYATPPMLAGAAGDLLGGWLSDRYARRSGNLKMARRGVAMFGFALAAGSILPATLTSSPVACVWYSCAAVLGLEMTVGVSWAIPLDIGADHAGYIASVMNTFGNMGSAISPALVAYLVRFYGWNVPFLLCALLCVGGMLLSAGIDATRRIAGTAE